MPIAIAPAYLYLKVKVPNEHSTGQSRWSWITARGRIDRPYGRLPLSQREKAHGERVA